MVFVLTVDQMHSRERGDLVSDAIDRLSPVHTTLDFARTVGDEFQALLENPLSVVDAIVALMHTPAWHIGLGIGGVERPLPADTRAARGPAYVAARTAVDRAKREPTHLSLVAVPPAEADARDAEVVLHLLAAIWERRSDQGWHAVDLMREGLTITEAAERLEVTRQAVGQRLQAASWTLEREALPVVGRLLARADRVAAAGAET